MAVAGTAGTHRREGTRARLLETALRLFAEHGVEGTSLQMIADELGVTKAAVYYHFRTKHDIVAAVAAPALRELVAVLDEAEAQQRRGRQLDTLLDGLVDVVVRYRTLLALFLGDPGFGGTLGALHEVTDIKDRITAIASGTDSGPDAMVRTHYAIAGLMIAGGGPELAHIEDDTLRAALLDASRRLLGRPRRHER